MLHTFRTSGSRTLGYATSGAGPLVVLLPGGPGIDPDAFFAGTHLPGFQKLVFFPRGTGESDPPATADGYRIAGYVDDLEQLRRHLGVPAITLYGSSHGASTALAYVSRYPERVERMVLAGGPARMDAAFAAALVAARVRFETNAPDGSSRLSASDEAGIRMRAAETENARRAATRTMIDTYIAHPTRTRTRFLDDLAQAPVNSAAIGPMIAEMMNGLDLLADADAVTTPTLVLTGDLDVRVPSEHMQIIAGALPQAELVRFPSAGHLPHVETPEEWASTVGAFLHQR